MHRTLGKRHHLLSLAVAIGAAAAIPACSADDPPPESNPVKIAEKAPPPISGGTMIVTKTNKAIMADSDRDVVWMVDLPTRAVQKIALEDGDEPGRVIEDGAGRIHVALRNAGAVAIIDPSSAKIVARTPACDAPRGMAYDQTLDAVHVACANGELVSLPAAGGEPLRKMNLERDLRDVMISGDHLVVSLFRTAELLVLDAQGQIVNRQKPPASDPSGGFEKEPGFPGGMPAFSPTVAWRTVPLAGGGYAMVHQQSLKTPVVISQPGGYGNPQGDCEGGIVQPTITIFDELGNPKPAPSPLMPSAALPVDVAADGTQFAMVAAGSNKVLVTSESRLDDESGPGHCSHEHDATSLPAQPVAVAFWEGKVIVQTREPAALYILPEIGTPITLPGESVADSGHDLFHVAANPSTGIACASCHPEGRDDAHTWNFDPIGKRRTQTVSGDVLETAPLHWDGDMSGLDAIMGEVFVNRMGGTPQGPRRIRAFSSWMRQLPAFRPAAPILSQASSQPVTQASIEHGKELFNDATVGCGSCHSGDKFTNNQTVDVGTGKAFQVPTLVGIANRAPFLHDGCAATLKDRFGACGGGDLHGRTSHLSEADIDDMVAYLETL